MKESEKMNGIYKRLEEEVLNGIDKKDILTIETDVKQFQSQSLEARAKAVICLQYLSNSGRFKENEFYKSTSFEHYIETAHGITYTAFLDMKIAIIHHYKDADKYGVGTIGRIRRTCGLANVGKVLNKIHAEEEKRKTPLTFTAVRYIINKNMIPKVELPVKPPEPDYKRKFEAVQESKKEADDELTILRDQVARQKETILRLKAKNETLLAENAALKKEIETLKRNVIKCVGAVGPAKNPPEARMQA